MPPPSTPKTRKKISDTATQEPETPKGLSKLVIELSTKSKLDEFRCFFDLKPGPWDKLRGQLNNHVQSNYSWTSLKDDKTLRHFCAEEFLEEYAVTYWGDGNREKNLIEDRLYGEDSGCKYPDDETPMIDVLVMLLEKSSKSRRTSTMQDVSNTRPDESIATGSVADSVIENKAVEQTLDVNQRDSPLPTPIPSIEIITRAPNLQEESAGGLFGPGRLITGGYLASPRAATEGLVSRHPPTTDVVQHPKAHSGSNMLATYFLVTSSESDNPQEPVCVPFEFFHDADDFLNKMEDKAGATVSKQLYSEMACLNRCYAVVHLNWSGVSFMIRRGKPDLQALENRVICAWNAKDEGTLNMIEFEIGVTLKPNL
ncbi:Heat shock protein DnaJ N-terminal [Penicillium atrosanguineum]|nr:Heat shock protein DnaJ N-terminal [Penicillium atrosanguineum]KAJ5309457.1 Heat shock protein DnaJ N-terminal [Penicillium atrosanguineum]